MTKEMFISSGKFTQLHDFKSKTPDAQVSIDCTDVVIYEGGKYIEVLKTNDYKYKNAYSKKLEDMENLLWQDFTKELYNL